MKEKKQNEKKQRSEWECVGCLRNCTLIADEIFKPKECVFGLYKTKWQAPRVPIERGEVSPTTDRQVGGEHYKKLKIQPWHVVDACDLNFYEGNAVKYIIRKKDPEKRIEDLEKAVHYCQKEIENLKSEVF